MRTIKSVSFNENDPFEKKLLQHAEQFQRFSVYIKRLIQRDMEGGQKNILVVSDEDVNANGDVMSFI